MFMLHIKIAIYQVVFNLAQNANKIILKFGLHDDYLSHSLKTNFVLPTDAADDDVAEEAFRSWACFS